jgi:hypothetical protein
MIRNYYKMAMIMSAIFAGSGASANDIYMEQVGSGNTVTITQDGAGNKISGTLGSTDNAYINTDGATIVIDQIGASNQLALSINNPNMASGMAVTLRADGSGNEQTVTCGTSISANCNATTITQDINGNNNRVITALSGGATSSVIGVVGNYNNVTHSASGTGAHTADIAVTGGGVSGTPNVLSVTQSGALAKSVSVTSNGSNNNIAITQSD